MLQEKLQEIEECIKQYKKTLMNIFVSYDELIDQNIKAIKISLDENISIIQKKYSLYMKSILKQSKLLEIANEKLKIYQDLLSKSQDKPVNDISDTDKNLTVKTITDSSEIDLYTKLDAQSLNDTEPISIEEQALQIMRLINKCKTEPNNLLDILKNLQNDIDALEIKQQHKLEEYAFKFIPITVTQELNAYFSHLKSEAQYKEFLIMSEEKQLLLFQYLTINVLHDFILALTKEQQIEVLSKFQTDLLIKYDLNKYLQIKKTKTLIWKYTYITLIIIGVIFIGIKLNVIFASATLIITLINFLFK